MMPVDFAAVISREFILSAEEQGWRDLCEPVFATDDEDGAYTRSPAKDWQFTIVIMIHPDTLRVIIFIPRGLNFGLKAACLMYSRKPSLFVAACRLLLAIPCDHYLDDFIWAAIRAFLRPARPDGSRPFSGQDASSCLAVPLGINFASRKRTPYSSTPESIGARTDVSLLPASPFVSVGVKPSTHGKIRAILSEILASGQLFPALAGSLEGKLNSFCQLYLPAKPAIQPISARHHNDNVDEDGDFLLHDELRVSLDYLHTIFASDPLVTWFRVLPDPNPPTILLTDAMWESAPPLLHG